MGKPLDYRFLRFTANGAGAYTFAVCGCSRLFCDRRSTPYVIIRIFTTDKCRVSFDSSDIITESVPVITARNVRKILAVSVSGDDFCVTVIVWNPDNNRKPFTVFKPHGFVELNCHISAVFKKSRCFAGGSSSRNGYITLSVVRCVQILDNFGFNGYVLSLNSNINCF